MDVVLRVAQIDQLVIVIVAHRPTLGGAAVRDFLVRDFSEAVGLVGRHAAVAASLGRFFHALHPAVQVAVGGDDVAVRGQRLIGQARQIAGAV